MEGKKKGKGLIIFLVVLIVVLVAALAVSLTLLLVNKEDKTKEAEKTSEKETIKDLEKDDDLVLQSERIIPYYFCGGLALKLEEKDVTIDEISNNEKLNMVIAYKQNQIIKTAFDLSTTTFKEEELKKYFKDLSFMDEFKPAIDTATDGDGIAAHVGAKLVKETIYPLHMEYKDGVYTVGGYGTGCAGPGNSGDTLIVDTAKKSNNELFVNYARYYREADFDDAAGTFVYTVYAKKGASEVLLKSSDIEKDENKIDTKKLDHFEFVYNIKDDLMQLERINYKKAS